MLAVFSNMGHIHAEQFDTKEAACCMDSLEAILDSNESHEHLRDEEYNSFFWHFVLFPERPVWSAPSA
jgi:hypothetical protein